MGQCITTMSKEYKLIQNFNIPTKLNLPKLYTPTETIFFSTPSMQAGIWIISKTNTKVVIKKLAKSLSNREMFTFEVYCLEILNHPSVGKIIEYFQTKFHFYIVYPYFDGKPIVQFIKENPQFRTIAFIKSFIERLLKIIIYIHNKKIAHRGIDHTKLIFDGKQLILSGFTNSREFDTKLYKTNGNCFKGVDTTLHASYWPPEQFQQLSTEKTDEWCVGVLTYILVSGSYPFESQNKELGAVIMMDPPNMQRLKAMKVSKKVQNFIMKCLQKDPLKRPSAQDLLGSAWFRKGSKINFNYLESQELQIDYKKLLKENQFLKYLKVMYSQRIMTVKDKELLTRLFNDFDLDGTGLLSFKEFKEAIQHICPQSTDEEVQKMFQDIDINRNGTVDHEEFVGSFLDTAIMQQKENQEVMADMIEEDFPEKISKQEFIDYFKQSKYVDGIKLVADKIFIDNNVISNARFRVQFLKVLEELNQGGKKQRRRSSVAIKPDILQQIKLNIQNQLFTYNFQRVLVVQLVCPKD